MKKNENKPKKDKKPPVDKSQLFVKIVAIILAAMMVIGMGTSLIWGLLGK